MNPWRWAALLGLSAAACAQQTPRQPQTPAAPRAAVAPAVCAAKMPGVDVTVEDTVRGARVLYKVADPRALEALRTDVQARARPLAARAAGGAPVAGRALPPVDVQVQILPNGQAVTYTAGDELDALMVRNLVKADVERQRRGECSALRTPRVVPRPRAPERRAMALTDIHLAPELVTECNLQPQYARSTIDTTGLWPARQPLLDRVVGCLTTGALPGSRLKVVGYVDEVGPDEYAMRYGKSRAEAVAEYLGLAGIDPKRIDVISEQAEAPGESGAGTVELRVGR